MELTFARPKDADAAVTIAAGGRVVAQGAIPLAAMQAFGAMEMFGVGIDNASSVLPGEKTDMRFPGGIGDVTLDFNPKP